MKRWTLIAARHNARLTQKQLAEKIGILTGSYCWYETGKTTPKVDVAIRIAKALGIKTFGEFCRMFEPEEGENE